MQTDLFAIAITSFVLASGAIPVAKRIALKLGIVARPSTSARKLLVIPVMGGSAMLVAFLIACAAFGVFELNIALPIILLCAVGVLDDAIELSPAQKMAGQLAGVAAMVAMMPRIALTPWPVLDALLLGFWLLTTTNAFNLVDGLDGLAGGVGLAACITIAVTAILHGHSRLALQALALSGALAGFLLYNVYPASIFMGDGGALPIGVLVGVFAAQAGQSATDSALGVYFFPVMVALVPLMDICIVCISRMALGHSVSRRGLDHSHHRLLRLGMSDRTVVAVCWVLAAIGGLCALDLSLLGPDDIILRLPFAVMGFGVLALFMVNLTFDESNPARLYSRGRGLGRVIVRCAYDWRLADIALDLSVILSAWAGAYLARLDFIIPHNKVIQIVWNAPLVLLISYLSLFAVGVYRRIWSLFSVTDLVRFAGGAMLAGGLLWLASILVPGMRSGSIQVLFPLLLFNFLAVTRLSFQLLRKQVQYFKQSSEEIVIVGAGQLGITAAQFLLSEQATGRRILGFVDDDNLKQGKFVQGWPVLGAFEDLERLFDRFHFKSFVIADELPAERLEALRAFAARKNITLRRFLLRIEGFASETSVSPALSAGSGHVSAAAGR